MTQARSTMSIAVAIPCYKVTQHVLEVIRAVPASVARIYAVDDACPEGSGAFIQANCTDPRVQVLFNPENRGVGGAVVTAYQQAIADGMDIVVKIDGDGQMDPALLPQFVRPIIAGRADYTKGNRFFRPESVRGMPPVRLFGNAVLSFMTKLSCGYWTIMDPTNGYTAVHTSVLRELPLDKLERRYFFETDMLFRLNTLRAVVRDVPMDSVYADEESNLKIGSVLPEFLKKHASRLLRRYAYSYFVRDFNAGSIYSIFGLLLLAWGSLFGARQWIHSALGRPAGHQRHGHAGRASRHGGYPVPGGLPAPRREQRADGTTEPATGGRARAGYGPPSRGPAVTRMSSAVPAPAEDASPTLPWIFCGLVLPMILYAARMVGVLVQTEIPFDSLHTYLPLARQLLEEGARVFSTADSYKVAPGTVVYMALAGADPVLIKSANLAISLAALALAFDAAHRIGGRIAAVAAGWLYALPHMLVEAGGTLLGESPFIFLVAVWLWASSCAAQDWRGPRARLLQAGVVLLQAWRLPRPR